MVIRPLDAHAYLSYAMLDFVTRHLCSQALKFELLMMEISASRHNGCLHRELHHRHEGPTHVRRENLHST